MARRNPEAQASTEADSTATEATEDTAEVTEPKPEVELNIGDFQALVAEILTEADTTTGELSVEALAKTTDAYRGLDGIKNKNAAREFIEDQMRSAIMASPPDGTKAKSYVLIRKSLSAGSAPKKAEPKDPSVAFVSKVAQLVAAQEVLSARVPEGVAQDWVAQVEAAAAKLVVEANSVLDADEGVEVDVSVEARKVVKLTTGKAVGGGSSYSGPRRSVASHIESAFADLNSGDFLTVNEIAKKRSDEYGTEEPSSGAVSARLFPASGKPNLPEGIVPVAAEDAPDGKTRGARKA